MVDIHVLEFVNSLRFKAILQLGMEEIHGGKKIFGGHGIGRGLKLLAPKRGKEVGLHKIV